jgi:2-keto-4-pentenoate hydratase
LRTARNATKKGQIVTTGSCTGMLFAPAGAQVQARLQDIGDVSLAFA